MTTIKSAPKVAHSKLVAGAMLRAPSGRFAAKAPPAAASGEATAASEAPVGGSPLRDDAGGTEALASRPKDRLLARLHRAR